MMDVLASLLMEEFVESTGHISHYAVQRDVRMLLRNMDYVKDMVHMILLWRYLRRRRRRERQLVVVILDVPYLFIREANVLVMLCREK